MGEDPLYVLNLGNLILRGNMWNSYHVDEITCPSMWEYFVFEEDLGMVLLMLKYILLLYP